MRDISIPTANVRNQDGSLRVSIRVAVTLRNEMDRFGITPARLRRHAWRLARISSERVDAALRGEAGHLRSWTDIGVRDWIELVQGAWLAD